MTIEDIRLREIFDSRGEPTIAVDVIDGNRVRHSASVPSGRSRGKAEASVFTYHDAERSILALRKVLLGRTFTSVREVDELLLGIDTTSDKIILGGNVTLAVSVALARAIAEGESQELWQVLRQEFFPRVEERRPVIYSNVINGGEHAANNLDIQEYMLVGAPRTSYAELVRSLIILYCELGERLKKRQGLTALPLGDEAGYCLNFKDNIEPLSILEDLIDSAKDASQFSLALDVAASSFYKQGSYAFGGDVFSKEALVEKYVELKKHAPRLVSIEDPFDEEDSAGFALLLRTIPELFVVGDDLTVTSTKRIETLAESHAINGVIIKPNQVGTVTESCRAMEAAKKHGLRAIVSHRSGETDDPFIIELAKAGSADAVKIGAPRNERINKFNELIRLYDNS